MNAPLHAETPRPDPARSAPEVLFRNGTTRRAFLASVAAFAATGAAAPETVLTAGPRGYNDASPGPLLRTARATPLRLTLVNALDRPTSLRLPGFRLDALAPGARRQIVATPRSAFDLYGPLGPTDPALFGAVLVEDGAEADLDVVAIVNGAAAALAREARPGARVRLRLAYAAREAALMQATGDVRVVAVDGYSCEPFAPRDGAFPMCPGARFELMFDLDAPFTLSTAGRPLVTLAPRGEPLPKRPPLAALPADPRLPADIALEAARQVKLALGAAGGDRTSFRVRRGQPVTLTLVNAGAEAETLRLEGHAARVLHALDDGWDPYWRDVLYVAPGQTLHAAFVADARGHWPLESVATGRRFGAFDVS